MKRIALLLAALATLVAGAAAAKEPAIVHATAALAVVGGEVQQPKLVWLDPYSLRQLKRGVVKLPGAFAVVRSPSGVRAAAGSSGAGLTIINVKRMKRVVQLALARRPGWSVHPISWPAADRILALEWNDRLGAQALLVVDPAARRVVRRIAFDGLFTWARAGSGVVAVGGPAQSIGPARLIVVDRNGAARTVTLDRISAGAEQAGTEEEPVHRMAWPGLAVDPASRFGYVVGKAKLVAQVDLESLAVTYRELTPARSLARRGKMATGWYREAVWVGDEQLAVSGREYDGLRSEPAGIELVDLEAGSVTRLEGRATNVQMASGRLVVAGERNEGNNVWTGMGVSAYTSEGAKLWHALDGQPVSWVQAAGGYAYIAGPDAYPPTVRVIDLADGAVRTLRGQMPMFVTD